MNAGWWDGNRIGRSLNRIWKDDRQMATAVEQDTERRHLPRERHLVTREQELDFFIAQANEARRDFEDAKRRFRELERRESRLRDDGDEAKLAACLRMKEETNPLTGNLYSGSAAQDYCAIDPAYAEHLAALRDVVFEKDAALTEAVSAKIRAQTAVAAVKAIGGWV